MKKQRQGLPSEVRFRRTKEGFGLILIIFIMLVFAMLVVGFVSLLFSETRLAIQEQRYNRAFYIAEAGKNFAARYLADFSDWSGDLNMPLIRNFGGGTFLLSTTQETSTTLVLYCTGVVTIEGNTYQRTIRFRATQADYDGIFDYSLYFGGGGCEELEIEDSVIYGDIYVNDDTEIDEDSSVANGLIYYSDGNAVYGEGAFTAEAAATVPALPVFDNSYYTSLISAYDGCWAGGSDNLTVASGTYRLNGETIRKRLVSIRGTARITGYGVIAATDYVDVFENAVIEPDPGKTIVLAGQNWVKIRDNATVYPQVVMYSKTQSVIVHDPAVEVYGALLLSSTKVDIYNAAVVTGESVVYLPPNAAGKENAVFDLEHGSTFYGSLIVEAAADKKVRLNSSDLSGLVYVPNAETNIDYMDLAGTLIVNQLKSDEISHSTISGGQGYLPSLIPQGFEGGGSAVGGVIISDWEEVHE